MDKSIKLTDQQYQVIAVLWRLGKASVRDVQGHLPYLDLATNTIATVLTRLEKKGYVEVEFRGRERLFKAKVSEAEVRRNLIGNLVSTIFNGDPAELMVHLVRDGEVKDHELRRIKALLDESEDV